MVRTHLLLLLALTTVTAQYPHLRRSYSPDDVLIRPNKNSRNELLKAVGVKAFTCPSAGVFPDPDPLKCQTYYRCTTKLVMYTYTCPGSSAFNKVTLQCTATIPASCIATTTSSTTTTTTSTPTTTTSTPTTTTSTTTTTPSTTTTSEPTSTTEPATISSTDPTASTTPLAPFVCPAPGVFAEPSNCTTYYRCTTTLIAYTYNCPGASLFDPDRLVCTTITPAKCLPTTTPTP